MKRYAVCLVMLVAVVAVNVFAAAIQEASGTLQRDKTWSGTIRVTGDVYVPPGRTLTILPGTVVRFAVRSDSVNHLRGENNCPAPKAELIVEGTLNAQGTEGKPILFTSDSATPSPGDWGGIILHGRATPVTLSYLVIEYADVNLMTFPSDIVIENCIIRNAYGGLDDCPTANHWDVRTGIFLHGERSIVRNCEITHCTWGFHINQGDRAEPAIRIENCNIHDNNVTSPEFDVPNGIHVYKSNVHIEGNTIENNEWGIEIGISNVVIIDNVFISNDFGVVIYSPDGPSEGYVHDNDVTENGMDYVRMTPAGPEPMPEDWFQDPHDTSGDSPNATNSDTTFTQIVIDGGADDWSGYPTLRLDKQGDTRDGGFDLKSVQAFTNDQYLYLLLDAYGDIGEYVQIDLDIDINGDGGREYMATFRPRTGRRDFGDFTSGQGIWNSMEGGDAAEGKVVELKMPLSLIGGHESFLLRIRVMNGVCCGEQWYTADHMTCGQVARADEIELPLAQQTERPRHFSVVDQNAEAGYLYRSFLQTPWDLAWGPDNCLYIVDMHGCHVVRLAPDGIMDDLGIWRNPGLWVDSPTALAFDSAGNLYVSDNPVIYAVSADGKVKELPDIQGGPVSGLAFSPNDELYYTDMGGGRVLKVGSDGRSHVVARGIPGAQDLAFGHDGALYVSQIGPNNQIVKVDVKTGVVTSFFTDKRFIGDPLFLAVDQEGDLWAGTVNTLFQLSPDGTPKPFRVDGRIYSGNVFELDVETAGGIAFDDKGRLWIASFTSTIWRLDPLEDPSQGMMLNLIVPGFCASDLEIGPDGGVYAYNFNPHPGELWRISPEGDVEVLHQFDHHGNAAYEKIVGLAMDNEGNLYIGLVNGEIKRLSTNGRLTRYAWLPSRAQRMTFGTDGCLYAAVGGPDEPKSIVCIVGVDNYSTLISRIDGKPLGPKGVVHVDAAPEEGLYLFDEYYSRIYYVDFDGQASVVADLPGTGSPATMAVSPEGDIFLVLHHALDPYPDEYSYSVLRIDPRGNIEIYAGAIMGDPLGAVISPDGRWLYISENGAIDKIEITNRE